MSYLSVVTATSTVLIPKPDRCYEPIIVLTTLVVRNMNYIAGLCLTEFFDLVRKVLYKKNVVTTVVIWVLLIFMWEYGCVEAEVNPYFSLDGDFLLPNFKYQNFE